MSISTITKIEKVRPLEKLFSFMSNLQDRTIKKSRGFTTAAIYFRAYLYILALLHLCLENFPLGLCVVPPSRQATSGQACTFINVVQFSSQSSP